MVDTKNQELSFTLKNQWRFLSHFNGKEGNVDKMILAYHSVRVYLV